MNTATFTPPMPATAAQRTRRLRVVHVVSTLNVGGLEKVVYDLVRLADREAFELAVVCLGEVGALGNDFKDLGIVAEGLNVLGRGKMRAIRRLRICFQRLRPDVVHTHNPSPHLIGAIAARMVGVKGVVHTKHGRNYPGELRKVWANRIATWFSDRIVGVSADAAQVVTQIERIRPEKVEVIHNGIDLDQFAARREGRTGSPFRAVHVARLAPPKDYSTLLEAVRRVADQYPTFELSLIGDGPDRAAIEARIRDLRLETNVRLRGHCSNVLAELCRADLFIISSTSEGLPISVLEAMAAGLPVVATSVGGNPEVVAQGETGLLVPAQSPREMADAILSLVRDPGAAAAMGACGRVRVEEHFDLRKVVARYEQLYREIVLAKGCRK